jgi:hypothetical protein
MNIGFVFKKDVESNYTKVPNTVWTLPVSNSSKILLAYLHSEKPNFVFYQETIAKKLGIARRTIYSSLRELVNNGVIYSTDNGVTYQMAGEQNLPTSTDDKVSNNFQEVSNFCKEVSNNCPPNEQKLLTSKTQDLNNKTISKTALKTGDNTPLPVGSAVAPKEPESSEITDKKENLNNITSNNKNEMTPTEIKDVERFFKSMTEEQLIYFNEKPREKKLNFLESLKMTYDTQLEVVRRLTEKVNKLNRIVQVETKEVNPTPSVVEDKSSYNSNKPSTEKSDDDNGSLRSTYDDFETINRLR